MLPSPLSFRGRAFPGFAALALSLLFAAALPAEPPRSEQTLTLGEETPEQPIKAGESHSWRLTVPPGTSVLVTVDQRSIGLVADVREPGAKKPMVFGAGNDRWGPVVLLLETAGDYKITVRPREKGPWPGRYTMRAEAAPSSGQQHDAMALISRAGFAAVSDAPESQKRAVALYRKALAEWHDLGETAWEAEARTCIAMQEAQSSELKPAAEDFREALRLWKELKNPQREAEILNWLGALYVLTQRPAEVREALESSVSIWNGLSEQFEEVQASSNLCYLEDPTVSLETALDCYDKCLMFFQKNGAPSQEAEILNSIGGVYDRHGDLDAALPFYQRSLDLWHNLGDVTHEVATLSNIGRAHRALGEWQEALRFYNRAWTALGPGGDRSVIASLLGNIGFAYNILGDPQRALGFLENALSLHRKIGNRPAEIITLNNLGTAWRGLGNWKKALDYYRKALDRATSLGETQQRVISRLGLAEVHLDRGDPTAALRELEAAFQMLGEKGDGRTRIQTIFLRGKALTLAGRPREALSELQDALARRRELRDRAGEVETLNALALAQRSLGLTEDALSQAREAVDIVDALRSSFLTAPNLRASFLATRRRSFSLLIDLLMARHDADPTKGYDQEAFKVSERARARSLLDVLRAGGIVNANTASPKLLAQRRSLLRRLSFKVGRRWQANGPQAEELDKEIDKLLFGIDGVEAEIREKDSRFADFSTPKPLSPKEISGWLEPDTMLLEYSLGDERSFLWAVEAGRVRSFVLPGQREIETLARQVYDEMSTVEIGKAHPGRAAARLGQILLGPVWAYRTGKGATPPLQRLVIVPDGALALLPFTGLLVPDPGRSWKSQGTLLPLLERVEVVSIPSATTLVVQRQRTRKRTLAPQWAAVFGDPIYTADDSRLAHRAITDRSRPAKAKGPTPAAKPASRDGNGRALSLSLQRLPETGREAEAIRKLAPAGKVKLDLGPDANRETVLTGNLRDFRVLHFATHAVASTESPELSGLVLSQLDAEGRAREGFLGLSDIYDLDLGADLVVLSGCRTAVGKEVRGEGLIGLTRAFQYAGVPRVVASLWPVEDRATAELMTRFYQAMWRDGLSPAAALRKAQRWLRQDPRYKDPHSWAGFVFQGDWRKIR